MKIHARQRWLRGRKTALLVMATVGSLVGGCGGEVASAPGADLPPEATLSRPLTYKGHDYLFIRSLKTWAQAGALCDSLGYGLVTLNDAAEETFLQGFEGTTDWWIGFNDQQTKGTWVWRNGTSSYTNWLGGLPDNYNNNNEFCTEDNYATRHGWNDLNCTNQLYFICESLD